MKKQSTSYQRNWRNLVRLLAVMIAFVMLSSCSQLPKSNDPTAAELLGNPEVQAICYGGYRENTRAVQPTLIQVKEDMKILSAMGIKLLRTYNVFYDEASTVLKAISELKKEDPAFEMYVMLGAWIDCKNAWTDLPERIRNIESEANSAEIERAVKLALQYPEIVKIIAVGNEAMVHWAWNYYVEPAIILKWVNHLQQLKQQGVLPQTLWITSSDNFASWGGGGSEYHTADLHSLIRAVDYVSVHTYPMHDTHYNPDFWFVAEADSLKSDAQKMEEAILRARDYARTQYEKVCQYVHQIDSIKPVHIGETGWASFSDGFYGPEGSKAVDEYKAGLYYRLTREWTDQAGISCFYFEAFDEPWKDAANPNGSENHFGLINLQGQIKFALWEKADAGAFKGLMRDGNTLVKTYDGDINALMLNALVPPLKSQIRQADDK